MVEKYAIVRGNELEFGEMTPKILCHTEKETREFIDRLKSQNGENYSIINSEEKIITTI